MTGTDEIAPKPAVLALSTPVFVVALLISEIAAFAFSVTAVVAVDFSSSVNSVFFEISVFLASAAALIACVASAFFVVPVRATF